MDSGRSPAGGNEKLSGSIGHFSAGAALERCESLRAGHPRRCLPDGRSAAALRPGKLPFLSLIVRPGLGRWEQAEPQAAQVVSETLPNGGFIVVVPIVEIFVHHAAKLREGCGEGNKKASADSFEPSPDALTVFRRP